MLLTRPRDLASHLADAADAVAVALRDYGERVRQARSRGDAVRDRVSDLLRQVDSCAFRLQACGVLVSSSDWHAPASAMISPVPGVAADATIEQQRAHDQAVGRADQARKVIAQWQRVEFDIQQEIAAWQHLQAERATTNQTMAARVRGINLVAQVGQTPYGNGLVTMRATYGWAEDTQAATAYLTQISGAPADVARYWNTLDDHTKQTLVDADPDLIGNLEGVEYRWRDVANRARITRDYEQAKADYEAMLNSSDPDKPDWADVADRLAKYEALYHLITDESSSQSAQVAFYDPSDRQNPLAAVANGDLDRATTISTLVQGMGSSVRSVEGAFRALSGFTNAARGNVGVVWNGYESPTPATVLENGYAQSGGEQLAAWLTELHHGYSRAGTAATPDSRSPAVLNVVAHSYGTTVTAFALKLLHEVGSTTRVHDFVSLGSAGLPDGVTNTTQLAADTVYATQADQDHVAEWGRPAPGAHSENPVEDVEGVRVFSSEADPAQGTKSVTDHDLTPTDGKVAYLDPEANSRREASKVLVDGDDSIGTVMTREEITRQRLARAWDAYDPDLE
ncbi:hypothetical protein F8O08_03050 [Pseudoclavibacter sp. CFCC 13611]|uniref:alpha/beta hydrolase n=1 Tax=Pseudoclavibacter sp. CFCC 14310 TaxID=2615180 RepID=UPI001301261D|nr:alpha/beta hydrolase [Pseudoclavibacter sp. CFCC 14310]KAB1664388.1 hypothetical protein F8O08_03050 [Pseudoclavibacter sp. CFCC 13611]